MYATRKARAALVRSAALAAAVLLAATAGGTAEAPAAQGAPAPDERLFAPYLSLDGTRPALLLVGDATRRGALVQLRLADPEGRTLAYGDHPVTISRAIPPGESIEIDLNRVFATPFEGSLSLAASRPVSAALALGASAPFPLVPARAGTSRVALASAGRTPLVLAMVAASDGRVEVRLRRGLGSESVGDVALDGGGSRLWVVPPEVAAGGALVIDASAPLAVMLLARKGSAGLAFAGVAGD